MNQLEPIRSSTVRQPGRRRPGLRPVRAPTRGGAATVPPRTQSGPAGTAVPEPDGARSLLLPRRDGPVVDCGANDERTPAAQLQPPSLRSGVAGQGETRRPDQAAQLSASSSSAPSAGPIRSSSPASSTPEAFPSSSVPASSPCPTSNRCNCSSVLCLDQRRRSGTGRVPGRPGVPQARQRRRIRDAARGRAGSVHPPGRRATGRRLPGAGLDPALRAARRPRRGAAAGFRGRGGQRTAPRDRAAGGPLAASGRECQPSRGGPSGARPS